MSQSIHQLLSDARQRAGACTRSPLGAEIIRYARMATSAHTAEEHRPVSVSRSMDAFIASLLQTGEKVS